MAMIRASMVRIVRMTMASGFSLNFIGDIID